MSSEVVEQVDRDAAADLYRDWHSNARDEPMDDTSPTIRALREGKWDACSFVQAFARHRISALSNRGQWGEAIEAAAKVARAAATEAANIALEGGERARANESMEAMATRIEAAILALAKGES